LRLTNKVLRRVAHEKGKGALLNLGGLAEVHGGEALEDALIPGIIVTIVMCTRVLNTYRPRSLNVLTENKGLFGSACRSLSLTSTE
jgi:hypothetical protein